MRKKIDDGSMMKKGEDMYDKMSRFMEGMTVGLVQQAKPYPIIVGQHYGLSDLSGFQSMQGGPSTFQTPSNNSFFEVVQAGPSYGYNNIMNRPRREHHPGIYKKSPYMDLPPTTVLPKKQGGKSKNKGKEANVSPFNLGNTFNDEDVEGDDVMIPGEQDTGIYFTYENMDPNK
nr:hypothetical protein [Tanacetum cinerariifolium]